MTAIRALMPFVLLSGLVGLSGSAVAEDTTAAAAVANLPAICVQGAAGDAMGGAMGDMSMGDMSMGGADHMAMMELDKPHQDLMAGMAAMDADMKVGMSAADIDVAFVCSMIPHHRGAIAMAKAELAHGDDPWAKAMAEAVIAAQEKEVADMLAWLDEQANKP